MTFLDVAPRITERQFQAQVVTLLRLHGWPLVYHTFDSRRSEAGFPDLVACRPHDGRLLIVELKAQRGRMTEAQKAWRAGLGEVRRVTVDVWRPSDGDRIERIIR